MAGIPWQAVAALVDPVRRALYEYVRRQDHPVTREEAAAAQAISRNLTAFHLDKLVEARLLVARYEAPADQPRGRGRTPKVYEPARDGLSVTVPARRYELVGQILADAVAAEPTRADQAATRLAFEQGREIGLECSTPDGTEISQASAALAELGFEPRLHGSAVTLRNCPFHALATRHPELICGLNRAFIAGLLAGLGATAVHASLQPQPGGCCVVVDPGNGERPNP